MGESTQATPKGEARLNAMLDIATQLFLEKGYEALSIDEIISRAGGSRRNIYGPFGGKEGLFQACILRLCEQLTGPIYDPGIDNSTLESHLHSLGLMFAEISLDARTLELHRLMVAEGKRFPQLAQKIYQSGRKRGADIVAPLIESQRHRLAASLTDATSYDLAEMFVSLVINETQLHALIDLDHLSAYQKATRLRVKSAVQLFINGVLREE
jgi:AcrR family transcriptional regulator